VHIEASRHGRVIWGNGKGESRADLRAEVGRSAPDFDWRRTFAP